MARWRIWYPDGLAEALSAAIEVAGGLRAAAAASHVARRSLSRFAKAETGYSMDGVVAGKLMAWLPEHLRTHLAMFDPAPGGRKVDEAEAARLWRTLGTGSRLAEAAFGIRSGTVRARAREELRSALREFNEARLEVQTFEAALTRHGLRVSHQLSQCHPRVQLAWERVLAPLLDALEADGMEPKWEELAGSKIRRAPTGEGVKKRPGGRARPTRLVRLLKLGMDRELLLLGQGNWVGRIQSVAEDRGAKRRAKYLEHELLKAFSVHLDGRLLQDTK